VDSPLTTQTDVSSSYGDEVLMTPPPMPSRLGRIIISSQTSSTDGSGSYVITNGEDESRTSSRRLNLRPSALRTPMDETTNTPSQEALVQALQQLQKLATLDSTEYQQRLLENTLPSLQTEKPLYCPTLAPTDSAVSSSSTQELSELSPSIQTPLVQLSMSIHRLHAAVANITREVDGHTDEVQELQAELAKLRHRNHQLETAAKKVHKKNLQLQKQAKHDRRKAQGMYQKVKEYEAQLESQGFQLLASKVQNHEILLSKTQSRERMDSNMSEFLDLEEDSHHDEEASNDCHSESAQTSSTGAESPCRRPLSESFMSDSSSKTEDFHSVPVIRFSKEGMVTPERTTNSSSSSKSTEKPKPSPSNSTVASTKSVEVESESLPEKASPAPTKNKPRETVHTRSNSNPESFSNRFARFLGPRAIANYNLRIVPPFNIQFVEIPLQESSQVVEDHGILVPANDGSTKSLEEGDALSPPNRKQALAVCGLRGFNDFVNMKPTIGAQITKINGGLIGERCTLQTLYSELNKHKGRKPVVLTFRNEKWDEEQTKILNAAIRDVENGNDNQQPDKEKADGASLFESSQKASNIGEEAEQAPRARTSSSDSVGKAIHGIGNFLHNLQHPE